MTALQQLEVAGSPVYVANPAGGATLSRIYWTAHGNGPTLANAYRSRRGTSLVYEGVPMRLANAESRRRDGYDEVTVIWSTPKVSPISRTYDQYQDNKARADGDEEWSIEGGIEWHRADRPAYNYQELSWNSVGNWGVSDDHLIAQPVIYLVCRRWTDTNKEPPNDPPESLPTKEEEAVTLANRYLPSGTSNYKLMHTIGDHRYLCVDINVEEDGDLRLETFRFQSSLSGTLKWNSQIYG
jgi:hypothetical protein